jgi:hypothetical protein
MAMPDSLTNERKRPTTEPAALPSDIQHWHAVSSGWLQALPPDCQTWLAELIERARAQVIALEEKTSA